MKNIRLKINDFYRSAGTGRRNQPGGFTLIEVLIAMLLMAMVVLMLNGAFKQYASYQSKLTDYQNLYTTVLSLRALLSERPLENGARFEGSLNGLRYVCKVVELERMNNAVVSEFEDQSGSKGAFELSLFRLDLTVGGKSFAFNRTRYEKVTTRDSPF